MRASAASLSSAALSSGRLVLTHSTHCEGLIAALRLLCASPLVHSVVPGRLATARGSAAGLSLRLGVATAGGAGYKLLARKGQTVQEVFVTVRGGVRGVSPDVFQAEMRRLLPAAVRERVRTPQAQAAAGADAAGELAAASGAAAPYVSRDAVR